MSNTNGTKKLNSRILTVLLAVMLALLIFTAMPERAYAEEAPPPDTSQEEPAEDPGSGDIDEGEEPFEFEVPPGSASVVEVVEPSDETDPTTGDPLPENVLDDEKGFTNDYPSVTITETYSSDPRQDPDAVPDTKTIVVTGTEDQVDEDDLEKLVGIHKETEYKENTPMEGQFTKTTVYDSDSAVTKAVKEALQNVGEDTDSVTVTVAPGEYYGDVEISTDELSLSMLSGGTLKDGFVFYLLSQGSFTPPDEGKLIDKATIGAAGEGGAIINGNLKIDGINVVMAGIGFGETNTVTLEGGNDFTYYGSSGDDLLNLTVKNSESTVLINTGDGDDTVSVTMSNSADASVDTGSGNDTLSITAAGKESSTYGIKADTGAGNDSVTVNIDAGKAEVEVSTGAGDDTIAFTAGEKAKRLDDNDKNVKIST